MYLLIKTQVNIWEFWLPGTLCKRTDMDSSASNSIDDRSAIGTVLSVGKERAGSQGGPPISRIHRWDFVKMKPLLASVQMVGGGRGRHLESKEKGIPPHTSPSPHPGAFCRRWDSNHHLLCMPVRRMLWVPCRQGKLLTLTSGIQVLSKSIPGCLFTSVFQTGGDPEGYYIQLQKRERGSWV